jgi:oligopeptide transport system substrate-binding protein
MHEGGMYMTLRQGKVFIIGLLLTLLLVACTGRINPTAVNKVKAPASQQVFRYPIGAYDFGSLDPALVQAGSDTQAVEAMFTGLVQVNDKGQVIDQLAASHSVSSDGLTYTFTLRPNLKFSDGTPLTSADVAYSINRTLLPATKSLVSYYDSLIKDYGLVTSGKTPTLIGRSILTPDANTVEIIISQPAAYFLQTLSCTCNYVVEKKVIDQWGTNWTNHLTDNGGQGGAGPFKAQNYSHTTGLTVVPNPNYYGKQPQLQKIEFLLSGDTDTTYNGYLTNQWDWAKVPPVDLASARARSQHDEHDYLTLIIRYLTMNYLSKPFDNIKIRQAFALAINKDVLVQTVLRGAVVPTNHIVPQGMVGYNTHLTGPAGVASTAGDQKKARALLQQGMQEAGYASVPALPSITFTYNADEPSIPQVAQALIQMWQTVLGVTVKPQIVSFGRLVQLASNTTNSAGPLQMWILVWLSDYTDPQDWLSHFFSKGADNNSFNYGQNSSTDAVQQQQVQQELLQADVNQDQNARIQAYNEAEQQIINDVGWIPFYQSQGHVVINSKVVGNPFLNALELEAPDNWANIYISQ